MFDIRAIRDNPAAFDAGLRRRGVEPLSSAIITRDEELRAIKTRLQEAQARRNAASKEIGKAKGAKDEALASKLMAEVAALKDQLQADEDKQRELEAALERELAVLPNIPLADVPDGADETANVEVRRWGDPKTMPAAGLNKPEQHFEIGEALGLMDFEAAARMSGARFVVLKGAVARLERALAMFMLDIHTGEFGYTECQVPLLVRDQAVYGTAQLPKFEEDLFQIPGENRLWLIPTAEVPLTNLAREQIIDEAKLPLH